MTTIGRCVLCAWYLAVLLLLEAGCARITVDTIRLTRDRFPAKHSAEAVEPLARAPQRPYREVADLAARGKSVSFEKVQQKILERAAELGADAVIFHKPEEHLQEGVSYQPVYSPWGYNDPYYGPDPWGYGGAGYGGLGYGWPGGYMAVPYQVTVMSLKGTAIIYTNAASIAP